MLPTFEKSCPMCGESISSLSTKCPKCGDELGSNPQVAKPSMSAFRADRDPEFVEDSRSTKKTLFAFFVFSCVGSVPFALNFWKFGNPGFNWTGCLLATICAALSIAVLCWWEKLPILAGLIPGAVAGFGQYAATAYYISARHLILTPELLIPIFLAGGPGLLAFVICVRAYYKLTE